ncbi:MAG: hypothetical protein HOO96_43995 [Polyangiaceae bacterium]|nr:hypothetical protein [Polyangiaceae bacterium]
MLKRWPGPKLLVSRDVGDVLLEYAEHQLSALRFAFGSTATGIALLCTFLLIAHVLEDNIPLALEASSKATAGTKELGTAMALLGQKFTISATGIGIAVAFAIANAIARRLVLRDAYLAASRCAYLFCTPASFSAAVQRLQLETLEAARSADEERGRSVAAMGLQLEDMRATLQGTRKDLEQLRSIEVSVKDIGVEVSTQFRKMLKEDLGEQIKEILQSVMVEASDMSERLRSELLEGFQRTLDTQIPTILESLQGIRQSVESQASSPVERMLEQLQGVVSGGMRGESAQMSAALKQFAEVVPALATQLQEVAHGMTHDMQQRTTENVRMSESLTGQVAALLQRLESQQAATEGAIAAISRASNAGAEAMMARLEAGSAQVMGGLLKTSRAEIDDLLGRLQQVSNQSAQGYGQMEASMASAARSISEAREGLEDAAQSIKLFSNETRSVVVDARQNTDASQRAATTFENAAGLLRASVESMRTAVEDGRSYSAEQRAVVEEHQKVLRALEELWPTLFATYLKSFDDKSSALTKHWTELIGSLGKISDTVGGGLAEAAEDLKGSVDKLAKLHAGNGARA